MSAIFFTADWHVSVFTVSRAYATSFTATVDQASLVKTARFGSTYLYNTKKYFKYCMKHDRFSLAFAIYVRKYFLLTIK